MLRLSRYIRQSYFLLKIIGENIVRIGYRTIKTAIGTPIAISIAQWLGTTNVISAGILAMLSIQPSRKKSVIGAWKRFCACLLAILISALLFELLGYHVITIAVLLLLFIPVTVFLKMTEGIMTGTVITLNLFAQGNVEFTFIKEQFLLIIIGIGTGLLINLYMPSLDKELIKLQKELEKHYQTVLQEIAAYIRDESLDWDGKEIQKIEKVLNRAIYLVELDRDNHPFRDQHSYYNYFHMRKKQFELLEQMIPLVVQLPKTDTVSELIASFFDKLAQSVHPGNTAIIFLDELKRLHKQIKEQKLPTTYKEFETRSNLFQLLNEIEAYLLIKNRFKKSDVKKSKLKLKQR